MSARLTVPRLLATAIAGSLIFATSAFAATMAPAPAPRPESALSPKLAMEYKVPQFVDLSTLKSVNPMAARRCNDLMAGFNRTIALDQSSPAAPGARVLSAEGGQLCASGMYNQGMAKIQTATHEIGPLVG